MALSVSEREYLLAINYSDVLGFQNIQSLYKEFGSFEKIYTYNDPLPGVSEKLSGAWKQKKVTLEKTLKELGEKNIHWLTYFDEEYPLLLKEISSPPLILYYQGTLSCLENIALGVVGSRNMTTYGKQVIDQLVPQIVKHKIVIVSGFQRGIDQAAHKATIYAQGQTIAVLGTGIDCDYPSNSRLLREQLIASQGLILSEYSPGTRALKQNFPRRNRIISGLSKAVLVVEATIQSGSLITARYAAEQNRDIYAVPGSIFSELTQGTHYLIQQGAKCVHEAKDIVSELVPYEIGAEKKEYSFSSEIQTKIFEKVKKEALSFDDLCRECSIPIETLRAEVTLMELGGVLVLLDDGTYISK